ncbi:hypothetical protein J3459_010251 [Metarhizium acridum]|nr:hypothetical protein J3459_010251 [Metarhizium acridum]
MSSCSCCQNPIFNDSRRPHLSRAVISCFPLPSASELPASSLPKVLLPTAIQPSFALKEKVYYCIAPPSRTEPRLFTELAAQSRPISYPETFFLRVLNVRLLAHFSSDPSQYRRQETRARHPGPPTPSICLDRGFRLSKIVTTDETHHNINYHDGGAIDTATNERAYLATQFDLDFGVRKFATAPCHLCSRGKQRCAESAAT